MPKTRSPVLNVELLDATLAEVERAAKRTGRRKPRWWQAVYRTSSPCGTAMCFAGHALTLAGDTWADQEWRFGGEAVLARPQERATARRVLVHRANSEVEQEVRLVSARVAAKRRLGLSEKQADRLFAGGNSLADLRHYVHQIKAGELR